MQAKEHESYWTFTILAMLFPIIGVILGTVFLAKDNKLDRKLGEHALVIGILFGIFWTIFWRLSPHSK